MTPCTLLLSRVLILDIFPFNSLFHNKEMPPDGRPQEILFVDFVPGIEKVSKSVVFSNPLTQSTDTSGDVCDE